MTNRKISALVASVIAHTRGRITTRTVTHPTRDWWIGLLLALGAALAVIIWSASVYFEYKREGFLVHFEPPATAQIYRPELVESALALMAERANTRQRLLAGAAQVGIEAVATEPVATSTITEGLPAVADDSERVITPDEVIDRMNDELNPVAGTIPSTSSSADDSDVVDTPLVDEIPILE